MTDDSSSPDSIAAKTDRLEAIITQLEDGEVSLERAQELHAEGEALLENLESDLELRDGTIHDHSSDPDP
ncbi:exodeoxyribonuclease VII small subunit [Halosimplex marinum]|uniref:exodeoxyribonuclease VII small subunit n=1 Tax=Halosimplex marinum TaxID=3396620 RepID=UPI003F57A0E6